MAKIFFIAIIVLAIIFGGIAIVNNQRNAAPQQDLNLNPTSGSTNSQNTSPTPSPSSNTTQNTVSTPIPTTAWTSANQATIKTAKGDIVIQLYPTDAPKTVMNFATLAKSGYYNNLTFHRVVAEFVIQGGDPNGNGTGGYSIYGPTFADELQASSSSYQTGYKEGVVAMANSGPNTNGSQFFIMLADNDSLPKNYTIFGKVTSGMDVVKQIVVGDKMLEILVQ